METLKLFLISSFIITSSLNAMDGGDEAQLERTWQSKSIRCPESRRTMIHETIKGHEEEIIKRDLISIPEYHASEFRGAYSTKLLDLYKTHNPTSKHYEHAKKSILANAITPPISPSDAHQLLTDHPITIGKDNPSDKELLWNIAAAAIVAKHEQLKEKAHTLMNENQIPQPDSNFMTYLLSYAIIAGRDDPSLDTCVDMGAKVEGIQKDAPFAPWLVGDRKDREQAYMRPWADLGKVDYSSPLDCAIRAANQKAMIWLKTKQEGVLTNQVWLYYLRKYAQPFNIHDQLYYRREDNRADSIWAILTINPNLEIDQETADMVYNNTNCSVGIASRGIKETLYPKTSWGYHLASGLKSVIGISHTIALATARTVRGDDAV